MMGQINSEKSEISTLYFYAFDQLINDNRFHNDPNRCYAPTGTEFVVFNNKINATVY